MGMLVSDGQVMSGVLCEKARDAAWNFSMISITFLMIFNIDG